MFDLFWLNDTQMEGLEPFFSRPHRQPCVDGRRELSGINFINRSGLLWRVASAAYGPQETLYNRWKRRSDKNIFARTMAVLATEHAEQKTERIDATYLKACRTSTNIGAIKGVCTLDWPNRGQNDLQAI